MSLRGREANLNFRRVRFPSPTTTSNVQKPHHTQGARDRLPIRSLVTQAARRLELSVERTVAPWMLRFIAPTTATEIGSRAGRLLILAASTESKKCGAGRLRTGSEHLEFRPNAISN